MIEFDREEHNQHASVASIKVIGVGGAGGNALNCMIEADCHGIEFIAVNTDAQALKLSHAQIKIQIGQKSTKGLGAGANPEVGKRAAEEDLDKVVEAVSGADIVFLAAGMGGGTGSGALPVIVKALKDKGILTIAVITKPFAFEGRRRCRIAEEAADKVKQIVDTLIIVPNQKLLDIADDKVSMIDGFGMINEVLNQSVRSISDIITKAGHINVDFADVREIMKDQGLAVMGAARASGVDRACKAALEAISSPLLENMSIRGARGVLLNITGGADLKLHEISQAASIIYEQADQDANIILGSVIDDSMGDEVSVTVIATGFSHIQLAEKVAANESIISPAFVPAQEHVQVRAQPVVHQELHVASGPVVQKVELKEDKQSDAYQKQPQQQQAQPQQSQERAAYATVVQQHETKHFSDQQAAVKVEKTEPGMVNLNDLDIPTFMRKQAKEKYHQDK